MSLSLEKPIQAPVLGTPRQRPKILYYRTVPHHDTLGSTTSLHGIQLNHCALTLITTMIYDLPRGNVTEVFSTGECQLCKLDSNMHHQKEHAMPVWKY